ncbi:MAG TPA: NTP transferase domain-containing protein [Dinghuibacter sp.]|uniref:NTP transferase domain-containing protein n=1 Tax=Dinghuibacter sp. TaxID=2024697 RepID=UPI002CEE11EA|nr:NTP transferase domain-containing protein [Dinghuibacter sp.]HTJ13802.1 NTP transferase domain-containing protein [Dinghuibacter sp.]
MSMRTDATAGTGPLMGIVLSGGESRRMGRDKGLMRTATGTNSVAASDTWAGAAGLKLETLGLPWRVSVRAAQIENYTPVFSANRLVIDEGLNGPLGGLQAAASAFPGAHFLLMACDMTEIDADILQALIDAYAAWPAVDYIAYRADAFAEPFPAIYKTVKPLKSLQDLLRQGPTHYLPVTRPEVFANRNRL